jgi:hypothetical protein
MMTSTRWAIEPVGAGIPEALPREMLPDIVARVNARRNPQFELTLKDIEFANACWNLERDIADDCYKKAFGMAAKVVAFL